MKTLKLEDVKNIELGIMDAIHSFAEEHKLEYCLAYGSLLGAVRHQGFIPWDDDMDIVMPRKSYEFFLKNFNNSHPKYKVINHENTKGYPYAFAKVIDTTTILEEYRFEKYDTGVYIDIFPIDDVENDVEKIKKQGKVTSFYNKLLQLKMGRFSYYHGVKKLGLFAAKLALFCVSRDQLIIKINKESQKFTGDTQYVADMVEYEAYGEREIMKKSWFSEYIKSKFEDREYYIPKEYDKVLSKLYGNYMKLPPKEKQVSHHSFDAWLK